MQTAVIYFDSESEIGKVEDIEEKKGKLDSQFDENKLMHTINRSIAIIKPKQPYVDWINSTAPVEKPLSVEDLYQDSSVIQFKLSNSSLVSWNIKSSGNFSMFLRTCSFGICARNRDLQPYPNKSG